MHAVTVFDPLPVNKLQQSAVQQIQQYSFIHRCAMPLKQETSVVFPQETVALMVPSS